MKNLLAILLVSFVNIAFASDKPNIIVFLVDDMGVMDTSVPFLTDSTGKPVRYPLNDTYRTPNMERLASQGVRFNNFCAMSVCSPSRISIQTGQNAARHRTTNWINPDKDNAGPNGPPGWNWQGIKKGDVTLANLLRDNGYRTMHVGKGHFGPRGSEGSEPKNIGFNVNVGGSSIGQPGSYRGIQNYGNAGGKNPKNITHPVPNLEKYYGTETFLSDALTLEAKSLISEAAETKTPFYLNFAHYAVHAPFESDPRYAANYSGTDRSPAAQAFATLIEGMDDSLGRILDHLDAIGQAENTLIFFLGDNGSDAPLGHEHAVACAAPLRGKKGSHYEGGMRVPFMASWAKRNLQNSNQKKLPITAGAIQDQQAAVQDLFPTILNLVGCSSPATHVVDGQLLDTLLTGKRDVTRRESFLMHYPHSPHRSDYFTSYRDGAWKVIYHYIPSKASDGSHYQLFNLVEDPFEQINLADSNPVELKRMMQGLVESLVQHNALYPIESGTKLAMKPKVPG